MSQDGVDECWMRIAEKIEEEVWDEYKVDGSKREACKGRGAHPEWRLVRRRKNYPLRQWSEDCQAKIFSWFREYNLQREHSMHLGATEKEEMK